MLCALCCLPWRRWWKCLSLGKPSLWINVSFLRRYENFVNKTSDFLVASHELTAMTNHNRNSSFGVFEKIVIIENKACKQEDTMFPNTHTSGAWGWGEKNETRQVPAACTIGFRNDAMVLWNPQLETASFNEALILMKQISILYWNGTKLKYLPVCFI